MSRQLHMVYARLRQSIMLNWHIDRKIRKIKRKVSWYQQKWQKRETFSFVCWRMVIVQDTGGWMSGWRCILRYIHKSTHSRKQLLYNIAPLCQPPLEPHDLGYLTWWPWRSVASEELAEHSGQRRYLSWTLTIWPQKCCKLSPWKRCKEKNTRKS